MIKSIKLMAIAMAMGGLMLVGMGAGSYVLAEDVVSGVKAADLPSFKRTDAGLYVTSKEAGAAMSSDPQAVLLDVRTIAEVVFVGAPVNAYNIPFLKFEAATGPAPTRGSHQMVANPDFVGSVEGVMKKLGKDKSARVFVMCRSGGRSAAAVNVLHKLGYSQVYTVIDGFEGGSDKAGKRTVSGWKNSGLAWTYRLNPGQQYRVPGQ